MTTRHALLQRMHVRVPVYIYIFSLFQLPPCFLARPSGMGPYASTDPQGLDYASMWAHIANDESNPGG